MKTHVDDGLEKQRLDLQLDMELQDTFPASDALKITRPQPKQTEDVDRSGASERSRAPNEDREASSN